MSRMSIDPVLHMREEMSLVESAEGIATHNTLAYPEARVDDYVLAQARLILGIVSEEEAQQLLAAEHALHRLFEALANEDEDS